MLPAHAAPDDPDAADDAADGGWDGPSKSQRKRDSDALQALGARLVKLSNERLKKIAMPDNLRSAIADAQRITAHGALRRQMQLVGKIMRSVDAAPLQAALDEIDGVSAAATARLHKIEQWRERLLADDGAFATLADEFPAADIQQLRQLRRNALREQAAGKPPRASRLLFRQLRELIEGPNYSGGDTAPNVDNGAGDGDVDDGEAVHDDA